MTRHIHEQRMMVLRGELKQTSGGLKAKDLNEDGTSKKASRAAKKRMKKEGSKSLIEVFKAQTGTFKPQPKKGTAAYKKLIKKM
jgi:hypothetical protein